jgi:hypothetical protein
MLVICQAENEVIFRQRKCKLFVCAENVSYFSQSRTFKFFFEVEKGRRKCKLFFDRESASF